MLWFGDPWPSYICYDEQDNLATEKRIPTPVGEPCLWCTEPIEDGQSGVGMGVVGMGPQGRPEPHMGYTHKECLLRSTLGSVEHLEGKCGCLDGVMVEPADSARTAREDALLTWRWIEQHRA